MTRIVRATILAGGMGLLAATLLSAQPPSRAGGGGGSAPRGLPLDATRKFELDTREGTWLSLDVSPDGQSIVFDMLGDLYRLPFAGGEAERLTSGLAYDAQPRFSPDGKSVVFVSDRQGADNIHVLDLATKEVKAITRGTQNVYLSPDYSPDGQYIVASKGGFRGGLPTLWMYHVNGGSGVALSTAPPNGPAGAQPVQQAGAAFSADGRFVYFTQRNGAWHYNAQFPQYQLYSYDRESGEREVVTSRYGSAVRPTLSPDGKWLVYGSRYEEKTGLRLRELATGNERWLAYPTQRDEMETRAPLDALPGMSFTPDSKELIASYGNRIWRVAVDGSGQLEVPFHAKAAVDVAPALAFRYPISDSATFTVRQIRDAVPSPDGRQLAFISLDRLYVMDWPAGTPRRISNFDAIEAEPAWSPDGKSLAWVTWTEQGGKLYRTQLAGKTTRIVAVSAGTGLFRQPVWSPDGSRLVVLETSAQGRMDQTGATAPTQLVWYAAAPAAANGGPATLIARAAGRSKPHFARDSSRIYLSSGNGLVSIRWDGTDEQRHLRVVGAGAGGAVDDDHTPGDLTLSELELARLPEEPNSPGTPAQLVMMSPKGDVALAQINQDFYTVVVPPRGTQATVSVADPATAAFPVRKLTDIGGQFPSWSTDGRRIHWSIGNAHVVYALDSAEAREAAMAVARRDSVPAANQPKPYTPVEQRVLVQAPRDLPTGTVVLRNARLVTMKGDEVIAKGDVVVTNHRIAAVGASGTVTVPNGAREIDLAGKTIVPGFVDTHAHLRAERGGIHETQPWAYLANLAYGVTTTRDPQTGTTDILTYQDMVDAGRIIGPRLYSTGPGVFNTDNIRDQEHARSILKRYSSYYDTKTIKMYVAGVRQVRQWIITAAREQQLMPTTEGSLDLKLNLSETLDGYPGLEHSMGVTPLAGDVTGLFAFTQRTYTPTLLVNYGGPWAENWFYTKENPWADPKLQRFTAYEELALKTRRRMATVPNGGTAGGWFRDEEYIFPKLAADAAKVLRAGGRIGIGSHGQLQGLGYHWEMWAMHSGGLTPHEVLRVATIVGARAIGLDGDVGSIEPGKLADLVVLDRDPLADLRNTNSIAWVMKNGRLFDGNSLAEEFPTKRPGPVVPNRPLAPATKAGTGR